MADMQADISLLVQGRLYLNARYFAVSWRMYATNCGICSGFSFCPNAGILPCPFVITAVNSASDFFCTSCDLRSLAFKALPEGELPLPSAAWHNTHFAWNTLAASLSACSDSGTVSVITHSRILNLSRRIARCIHSPHVL